MRKGLLALVLAAAAVPAAAASVPEPWSAQLAQQLAHIEEAAARNGFARVAGPFSAGAAQGEAQRITLHLDAGGEYRIAAVCDADCTDIDLRLFDQNGRLIEEDLGRDDHPIVSSLPAWSGAFVVEARMHDCRHAEGCYFAVDVYGRARGL